MVQYTPEGLRAEHCRAKLMRKVHGEIPFESVTEDVRLPVMLGMACGDALEPALEFSLRGICLSSIAMALRRWNTHLSSTK